MRCHLRTFMGLELWLNQVTSFKPHLWLKRAFVRRADQTRVSPFHAVAIRCTKNACQAAQDSHGERYLSAEAPLLPLGQCDRPDRCQCRYQHHKDRRGGSRRGAESGLPTQSDPENVERRHGKGRRIEDVAEDAELPSLPEDTYYGDVAKKIRDPSDSA